MSKRERVERTMNFQETDRIPVYDLLLCDAAIEMFSGKKLPPLKDDPWTRETVDRITGRAIAKFLDMTRCSGFGPLVDSQWTDDFGFVRQEMAWEKTGWIAKRPFSDEAGAMDFLKTYIKKKRDARKEIEDNPGQYRVNHRKSFLEMQARLGDTLHLFAVHGTGLDEIRDMLGWELFVYVNEEDSGLISEALEETMALNVAICHATADIELSPAVLTYGDIACKTGLMHSPDYLQKEFLPRLKRLNDAWHEHGFKCLYHSDGYLMDIMDDLVATGIDGLNPIETLAGMKLKEVREKYPRLFLAGGIDMSQLLSLGAPDQVREVCQQAIRDASPGYFIGSTTEVDNSSKAENLLAMFEVAHAFRN